MRFRLAHPDDEALASIAKEVRGKKDDLTEHALRHYAEQCDAEGFPDEAE